MSSYPDDDMPIQSKGGYNLDFDNLDGIDPFQGSNKMMLSPAQPALENPPLHLTEPEQKKAESISEETSKIESALDETLPFIQSVENSMVDVSNNLSSTESSVVTVMKASESDSYTATPDDKQCAKTEERGSFSEDAPLPPSGTYNLDYDNLDAIDPFQTGGSKIQNSPALGRKALDINQAAEEMPIKQNKPENVDEMPKVASEVPAQPEMEPKAGVAPVSVNASKPTAPESQPSDAPSDKGPVKLEFSFDDNEVKQKPPPKKIGKRPLGQKPKAGKPSSEVKTPKETPVTTNTSDIADVPEPKGSYSFDFEKLDDPNFNPFGTKANMTNSPQCSKKSNSLLTEDPIPDQTNKLMEKEDVSPTWCVNLF